MLMYIYINEHTLQMMDDALVGFEIESKAVNLCEIGAWSFRRFRVEECKLQKISWVEANVVLESVVGEILWVDLNTRCGIKLKFLSLEYSKYSFFPLSFSPYNTRCQRSLIVCYEHGFCEGKAAKQKKTTGNFC